MTCPLLILSFRIRTPKGPGAGPYDARDQPGRHRILCCRSRVTALPDCIVSAHQSEIPLLPSFGGQVRDDNRG